MVGRQWTAARRWNQQVATTKAFEVTSPPFKLVREGGRELRRIACCASVPTIAMHSDKADKQAPITSFFASLQFCLFQISHTSIAYICFFL